MKVIFLIDSLGKGGKERRMLELIKELLRIGNVEMELVVFKDLIEYPVIYDLNIKLHIIERKTGHTITSFFKVYKICKAFKPDIIHSWATMCTLFAIPTSYILNIKIVNGNIAKAPSNLHFWKKELILAKITFLFSDIIIGNSSAGLNAYDAPKSKSIAIKNGFDFKRIQNIQEPESIKKKYNIKTPYVVAKIAAFANRKDYDTYIRAAQIILAIRKDISFLAIGNGPNLNRLKDSVNEIERENIIFTGAINDIESIVNIIDIGILSTNDSLHGEGISNSILEYMAMKKPVIATKGGGTDEIVLDNETGYLIPPKSPQIMADKIIELINNQKKSITMGLKGQNRIKEHFNLDYMGESYLNVYNKLLN